MIYRIFMLAGIQPKFIDKFDFLPFFENFVNNYTYTQWLFRKTSGFEK